MNDKMIEIFQDTLAKSDKLTNISTTTKHFFENVSLLGTKPVKVSVVNKDGVTILLEKGRERKVCILNMASYKRPGGGVEKGSRAQEEHLFRCSNLFRCISKDHYPLEENSGIYTKNATFIKNSFYDDVDPVNVDVVTVAAINLRENPQTLQYLKLTRDKIRLMVQLAAENGAEVLILGAWGCGVFKNDPELIASLFKDVLYQEKMGQSFNEVIFAVINDHNSVANNYEIFKNVFDEGN